jgi:ATP-binding cassette subfamily F protein uup
MGYLQDFLFTPDRARRPARYLSGGERNRLMLARLFKRPSNVMVLDEPTNDLDEETLELLEELVSNYPGTVLLVSHDRAFLNNVVTSTIVFEGNGKIREFDGGYNDYIRQRDASTVAGNPLPDTKPESKERPRERPRKLSFKEQQELAALPELIEQLEGEQNLLHQQMSDPAFFKQPADKIAASTSRLDAIGKQLPELYSRWETLAALE